jgi:hypothetical protein
MRLPSLLSLLGALQHCGLTYAHLALFLALCRAKHTGPVVFHLASGRIVKVEGLQRCKPQWHPCETPEEEAWAEPWA